MKKVFLLSLLLLVNSAFAQQKVTELEVDYFFSTVEENYAPLKHKEAFFNFSWQTKKANYRQQFLNSPTRADYYKLVTQFLAELQDAHVSFLHPYNTKTMKMPLQLTYVNGKTLVSYIGGKVVKTGCQVVPGDELVDMDGMTPNQLRQRIAPYVTNGNAITDVQFRTYALMSFNAQRGIPLDLFPSAQSVFKFTARKTGKSFSCKLSWDESEASLLDALSDSQKSQFEFTKIKFKDILVQKAYNQFLTNMKASAPALYYVWPKLIKLQNDLASTELANWNRVDLPGIKDKDENEAEEKGKKLNFGESKPFFTLPKNFKKHAKKYSRFSYSGTFERNGFNAGFMRIPSYVPSGLLGLIGGLGEMTRKIQQLEEDTDYLIIDQTNNPGGYVAFGDWVVQYFTGKIDYSKHMKFRQLPNLRWLNSYTEIINSANEVIKQEVKKKAALQKKVQKASRENRIAKLNAEMAELDKYLATCSAYKKWFEADYTNMKAAYDKGASYDSHMLTKTSEFLFVMLVKELKSLYSQGLIPNLVAHILNIPKEYDVSYSKPIFMHINEMDFSGGDFVPATLEDYGRITLIGERTAGAGGSVGEFTLPYNNKLVFRLTDSLMVRKNNQLVENYGVQPSVKFQRIETDVVDNYKNYFERFMKEISKISNF